MSKGVDGLCVLVLVQEEKDELTGQMAKLEAQLEYLKHTAAIKPECFARALMRRLDHKLFEQEMHNHLLREAVRNQHFQLFSAQSALSELTVGRWTACFPGAVADSDDTDGLAAYCDPTIAVLDTAEPMPHQHIHPSWLRYSTTPLNTGKYEGSEVA